MDRRIGRPEVSLVRNRWRQRLPARKLQFRKSLQLASTRRRIAMVLY